MKYASKPLTIVLEYVRENPVGQPHGDVHLVLNIKFARKRKEALCGMSTDGMRKLGSGEPFRDWQLVLCSGCDAKLEI